MSGTTLVAKNQKSKSNLTKSHATFYRHRTRIEKLRFQHTELEDKLEQALQLYQEELEPLTKKAADKITEFVLLLTSLSQKISFQKADRVTLNEIVQNNIKIISTLVNSNDIHDDIKKLFKDENGNGFEKNFQQHIAMLQEYLKEETGLDIDLSDIDPNDSERDIFQKIAEKASSFAKESESGVPPKQQSKKESVKEIKLRELKEIQNKNLNTLYKRLAKEIHPDLEQNPEIRQQKEEQMKVLTTAYEEGDLFTLLKLESDYLESSDRSAGDMCDETIKIYNSLLKDQINLLESELDLVCLNPRFIDIGKFIEEYPRNPVKGVSIAIGDCKEMVSEYSSRISDISRNDAKKILKVFFEEYREQKANDLFTEALLEMFDYDDDDF